MAHSHDPSRCFTLHDRQNVYTTVIIYIAISITVIAVIIVITAIIVIKGNRTRTSTSTATCAMYIRVAASAAPMVCGCCVCYRALTTCVQYMLSIRNYYLALGYCWHQDGSYRFLHSNCVWNFIRIWKFHKPFAITPHSPHAITKE